MTSPVRFTTLTAVDRRHLDELRLVWPGWMRRPDIASSPIVLLYDERELKQTDLLDLMAWCSSFVRTIPVDAVLPAALQAEGVTQRERMLSAIAYASGRRDVIETPYVLKLDTDTAATATTDAVGRTWTAGDPVIAAPRWGYTKPGYWLDILDRWADRVAPGNPKPGRLMGETIARSSRIISYVMLGRVDFIEEALRMAGDRLPVPSQDTFLWYAAKLLDRPVRRLHPPEVSWRHYGGNYKRMMAELSQ